MCTSISLHPAILLIFFHRLSTSDSFGSADSCSGAVSSSVPLGSGGAPVPTPKSSADEGVHEEDVEAVICDTAAVHYENTTIDGASILAEGVDSISFSKVLS